MKKRIFSLVLLLSILLSSINIMPITSLAVTIDSGTCGDNLTWSLDDEGTLTISGNGDMTNWSSYSNVVWKNLSIKNVVIENGITTIGDFAFYNQDSLTNIVMPETISGIGRYAFATCDNLVEITFPKNLQSIGQSAFEQCMFLERVSIPKTLKDVKNNAFKYCIRLTEVNIEDIGAWCEINFGSELASPLSQWGKLYINNTLIERVVVPETVTYIGDYVFSYCTFLKEVVLHNGIKSIGENAFYSNSSVTVYYTGTEEEWNNISISGGQGIEDIYYGYAVNSSMINFNHSGGSGETTYKFTDSQKNIILSDLGLIKQHYKFVGWSENPSDIEAKYFVGNQYNFPSDIVLYAIWEKIEYIIKYSTNGTNIANDSEVYGRAIHLTDKIPTRPKYIFKGWSTTSGSSEVEYNPGDLYTGNEDITLYAVWEPFYSYTISNNEVKITGCATELKNADIPSEIEGYPVTSIASEAFRSAQIETVKIPDSVYAIAEYAFRSCSKLKSITFGKGLATLTGRIFYGCSMLSEIYIPSTLQSMTNMVFYPSITFNTVYYEGTKSDWETLLANSNNLSYFRYLNLIYNYLPDAYRVSYNTNTSEEIEYQYFKNGTQATITNIIPQKAKYQFLGWSTNFDSSIPEYFSGETYLFDEDVILYAVWKQTKCDVSYETNSENNNESTTVDKDSEYKIPEDTPERECYVFLGWSTSADSNEVVYMPGDTLKIENDMTLYAVWKPFYSYTISNGEITITGCAPEITEAIIPAEIAGLPVTTIGKQAFYDKKIKKAVIPDSVVNISYGAFYFCKELEEVDFSENIVSIGGYAFYDCDKLKSAILGESVQTVGEYAFWSCDVMSSASIPSVTVLPEGIFLGCANMENLVLNKNITSIGRYALSMGEKIKSFVIPDSVTDLSDGAFQFSHFENITIGSGISEIKDMTFYNCALKEITIPDNILVMGERVFEACGKLETVTLGGGLTEIPDWTFIHCGVLKEINILDNIKRIGQGAFNTCSNLKQVTIGSGVEEIGEYAFCASPIEELTVSGDNSTFSSLDNVLFSKDKKELVLCANGKQGEYTVPDAVTSMRKSAFAYCNELTKITVNSNITTIPVEAFYSCWGLKTLIIPNSVTVIEDYATSNCNELENVYYIGTTEEWENISIGSSNSPLHLAKIHYVKHTKTVVSEEGKVLTVNPINIENGKTVILALYNGDKFVEAQTAIYEGKEIIFTTDKAYTYAKVAVWNDLTSLIPVTDIEIIE